MKAILNIELKRPYSPSLDLLLQMSNLWKCDLIKIRTKSNTQTIGMPWKGFKRIWGKNPVKGEYEVPNGTEDFINGVTVIEVKG